MSPADPADQPPEVLRDGAGRPYADAEPLPDLPQVLGHARRLGGLAVADAASRPSRRTGGEWALTFTCGGHRFGIHTSYHAGVTRYSSPDPDCPEPLLREVVARFEGLRLPLPAWVPPPPLGGRRLLLFLIALAAAAALAVFLVLSRGP